MTSIDPHAMNIGNNVQQRPCIPTKLSSAAMELVRLYDQLHAFKDDPEFIRVGFAGGRTLPGCKQSKGIETLIQDWSYWMNWGSFPAMSCFLE